MLICEGLGEKREEAQANAQRLVDKVRELLAEPGPAGLPTCAASIGVHLFIGSDTPPEQMIKAADLAMYHDKSARRPPLTDSQAQQA